MCRGEGASEFLGVNVIRKAGIQMSSYESVLSESATFDGEGTAQNSLSTVFSMYVSSSPDFLISVYLNEMVEKDMLSWRCAADDLHTRSCQ